MATKLKKMKLTSVDLVRAGANQEASIELFKSEEPVEKDAQSFEEITDNRKEQEKLWGYNDALSQSIRSIQEDRELDEETRQDLLQETWEQYCAAMAEVLGLTFEEDAEPEPEETEDGEPEIEEIEEVQKYNHNHGPDGRFASSGGSGGGGSLNAKLHDYMASPKTKYDVGGLVDEMKIGDSVTVHNHKKNEDYEFVRRGNRGTIMDFENVRGRNHLASTDHVKGFLLNDVLYGGTPVFSEKAEKSLDTIEEVQKFNPFHDALGRFASSNGFASYSANPKTKAGQMAIGRSARAGHGSTWNVHRESKGENIGQNYAWMQG